MPALSGAKGRHMGGIANARLKPAAAKAGNFFLDCEPTGN